MALEDKLTLARTLERYKASRQAARNLNEIEDRIKARHDAEVAKGTLTQIDFDSIDVGDLAKELPDADELGELTAGNSDDEAA